MLKSVARAAGFLAYLFITLEMLFMVTPFALHYYSVYSPVLTGSFNLPATAWLPAFFLPHLSTEILPRLELFFQAHSPSSISVPRNRWSRAADRVAALYPADRVHQHALVLLPSGA